MVTTRSISAVALLALLASPSLVSAQRSSGRGLLSGGIGLGGSLEFLARNDVRKELELVDHQIEELNQLRQKLQQRAREVFSELRQAGDREGARDRIRDVLRESNQEIQTALQRILLPHQYTRLQQLQLQLRMRGGVLGALASPQVLEDLGISDEQRDQLRQKGREAEQEFRQKLAELRQQTQAKLLALLTPEQREQFQKMVGSPFEFQDEPRRGRGAAGIRLRERPNLPTESP